MHLLLLQCDSRENGSVHDSLTKVFEHELYENLRKKKTSSQLHSKFLKRSNRELASR